MRTPWLLIVAFGLLYPFRLVRNYRMCRRDGIGIRRSIDLAYECVEYRLDVNQVLNDRLADEFWLSEHPGATVRDLLAFRNEELATYIQNVRAKLDVATKNLGLEPPVE